MASTTLSGQVQKNINIFNLYKAELDLNAVVGTSWIIYQKEGANQRYIYVINPPTIDALTEQVRAMQLIINVRALEIIKECFDYFFKLETGTLGFNGLVSYLKKLLTEVKIDTTTVDIVEAMVNGINAESNKEAFGQLKKLINYASKIK